MSERKAAAKTFDDIKDMTFERALKELEAIVGRLERGDVDLEESIAIYERGEALRDHCDRLLKAAEAKVEKLTLGADGAPTGTTPLDKDNGAPF
ncbi:exodeoxyribonuclease VII small subunit [Hyphomicrobium sp.]|jgi:exodeoxyribonuclease VII small subunit|uniref:exodeoxyribonuclease VII small subunit n=1 Tax=Hyphomicrobium sp. TaxID=82 RepID=UPI002CCACC0B|nr:exodeoxyribonuclease VII small subunit [Hyphomicrobium sp.]HVZ04163.1 exodeoxyribonuclease VII small subunit [Hyphomicrobium sp.]